MTRLLIVRHGETDWNAEARVQGYSNVPLNEAGREQARRAARMLTAEPVDAVYASDLDRAGETARILAGPHHLPVTALPGLRERCWGAWEGRTLPELDADDHETYTRLRAGEWVDPDGAERYPEFQARAAAAIQAIAANEKDRTAIIATHGGTVKVIMSWVMGAPASSHSAMRAGNAHVTTVIVRNGRFVLEAYNVPPPEAEPDASSSEKVLIESAF